MRVNTFSFDLSAFVCMYVCVCAVRSGRGQYVVAHMDGACVCLPEGN